MALLALQHCMIWTQSSGASPRSEKVAAILESLHIKRPLPVQSMYIFKVGFQLSPCMHVRSAHHCQVWLGVSGQTVSIHPILALYSC